MLKVSPKRLVHPRSTCHRFTRCEWLRHDRGKTSKQLYALVTLKDEEVKPIGFPANLFLRTVYYAKEINVVPTRIAVSNEDSGFQRQKSSDGIDDRCSGFGRHCCQRRKRISRFGDSPHTSASPGKSLVFRLLTGGLLVRVERSVQSRSPLSRVGPASGSGSGRRPTAMSVGKVTHSSPSTSRAFIASRSMDRSAW